MLNYLTVSLDIDIGDLNNVEHDKHTNIRPVGLLLHMKKYNKYHSACNIKHNKVRKKAKIRNRYNQAAHLTQDTTRESDQNTINHQIHESQ